MKNFENDKDEICLECGTSEFCGCNYSFDPDDETFEPIYDDDTDDDDDQNDDTIAGTIVTTVAVAAVVVAPVMMMIGTIITGTITWMINPSN